MIGNSLFLALLLLLSMTVTYSLTPRYITLLQQGDRGLTGINYEGNMIVNAGGIVLLPAVLLSIYYYFHATGTIYGTMIFLVFLAGMVVLGLVDDLQGDKGCKGFRGHMGLLWREKKVSTGLLKAAGGFTLAMLVAAASGVTSITEWLAKGIFLALFANLFNLLDTRPAMAIKAFYLISLVLMLFGIGNLIFLILWVSLYVYLPWELSHKIMLGDTGAYLLGGTLGFFALTSFSTPLLYSVLIPLLLLHIFMEKYSVSKILEGGSLPLFWRYGSLLKRKGG